MRHCETYNELINYGVTKFRRLLLKLSNRIKTTKNITSTGKNLNYYIHLRKGHKRKRKSRIPIDAKIIMNQLVQWSTTAYLT